MNQKVDDLVRRYRREGRNQPVGQPTPQTGERTGVEGDSSERRMWRVVHDGPSRPMIESPDGRLLSISQFEDGRWSSYEREEEDCKTIVNSLNTMTMILCTVLPKVGRA